MVADNNQQQNPIKQNKKAIVICADDFGQASKISQGISELLHLKRINATSCLTNFDDFQTDFKLIKEIENIDIGLHLNLTEGKPLTSALSLKTNNHQFKSLNTLLIKSQGRALNKHDIYQELKAQLDCFIDFFGFSPHFLDGHQHIHHLPIVREVVFDLFNQYHLKQNKTYIRSVNHLVKSSVKGLVIKYTGATTFRKQLKKNHILHNDQFGGIYDFKPENFKNTFENDLSKIKHAGLLMCHPGYQINGDVLNKTREVELNYFKSKNFLEKLIEHHLILKRGKMIFS